MNNIQKLSPTLIAKIKAGEVIERPAYAVKELLENSIDAGATNISIELEESGLKKIIITDNGVGMNKKDLELSFLPHTTSKLFDEHGLLSIQTLGFRGEALSSIAAISNLSIQSRTTSEPIGNKIELKVGTTQGVKPVGMPIGTRIVVDNLFISVPARKKFLKSARTEYRHILDIVLQYATSFPNIRFSLTHNNRKILDFPPTDTIFNRIEFLIGHNLLNNAVPISYEDSYVTVSGLLGKPHLSFSTSQKQFLFVNNRLVSDKSISLAVKESFGTMLDASSYPFFVLFLTVPFELVDVNVHPRKEQISFINPQFILSHIKEATLKTLSKHNLTFANISWQKDFDAPGKTHSFAGQLLKDVVLSKESLSKDIELNSVHQIHNLYVLLPTKNGLQIIDQHAAHERILFEKLHHEFIKQKNKSKPLKLKKPIPLTFSINDYEILHHEKKYFSKLGFNWKIATHHSIILNSIPHLLKDRNPQELINELINDINTHGTTKNVDEQSYKMLAFLACRAAVKAGDKLTKKQMEELIKQLDKTDNNYTCPHGRPTRVEVSLHQLNTFFKR